MSVAVIDGVALLVAVAEEVGDAVAVQVARLAVGTGVSARGVALCPALSGAT